MRVPLESSTKPAVSATLLEGQEPESHYWIGEIPSLVFCD